MRLRTRSISMREVRNDTISKIKKYPKHRTIVRKRIVDNLVICDSRIEEKINDEKLEFVVENKM